MKCRYWIKVNGCVWFWAHNACKGNLLLVSVETVSLFSVAVVLVLLIEIFVILVYYVIVGGCGC